MNSLLLLRKSVSSKRVTLASLTQQALLVLNHNNEQFIAGNIHNISTSTRKIHNYTGGFGSSKVQIESFLRKDFHAGTGGSLHFGASSGLSQAASYAVADSSVKGAMNDEHLEIAKLGIAGEIFSALAKKESWLIISPLRFLFYQQEDGSDGDSYSIKASLCSSSSGDLW